MDKSLWGKFSNNVKPSLSQFLSPILAILLSILSGAILFAALGIEPATALYYFIVDPLKDIYGVSELLLKISPILICALGLLLCFKAGLWNIGAEGQYIIGAIAGGWCALNLAEWNSGFAFILVILCGILGGVFWALIAAMLKVTFRSNEILTTIMLNYIAIHFLMYCLNGPLKNPSGFSFPESAIFEAHTLLPLISEDYRLNISIFFPLILVFVIGSLLKKTMFGFEVGVLGKSLSAAKNAGINLTKNTILVFCVCGACAGLAGAAEVAGPVEQLIPQLSVGYGYTAIICVYLGRMHPVGIVLASSLLGITYVGAENLQIEYELPRAISSAFQGLILFYLLTSDYLIAKFKERARTQEWGLV